MNDDGGGARVCGCLVDRCLRQAQVDVEAAIGVLVAERSFGAIQPLALQAREHHFVTLLNCLRQAEELEKERVAQLQRAVLPLQHLAAHGLRQHLGRGGCRAKQKAFAGDFSVLLLLHQIMASAVQPLAFVHDFDEMQRQSFGPKHLKPENVSEHHVAVVLKPCCTFDIGQSKAKKRIFDVCKCKVAFLRLCRQQLPQLRRVFEFGFFADIEWLPPAVSEQKGF